MKHETLFRRAFNGIAAFAIAIALILSSAFLYRVLRVTVEAEILMAARRMDETIMRVAGTEYRRYFMLIDLGRTLAADGETEGLIEAVEQQALMFRSDGEIPDMIKSIGYYRSGEPDVTRHYDVEERVWTDGGRLSDRKINRGGWGVSIGAAEDGDINFYITLANKDNDIVTFFAMDRTGFLDNYLKDAVESYNTDFTFVWYTESRDDFNEGPRRLPEESFAGYRFNPFRILFGPGRDPQPLVVEIPGLFEIRKINEADFPGDPDEHDRDGVPFLHSEVFVKVYHKDGSFYHEIERNAVVNFFEVIVVLIITAILFYLMLYQLQRTRLLRKKEKEFVASVTHELRTPLTVIRSAADNLSNGIVPAGKTAVYGGLISEQSERLGNMIEEILLYSKFEDKVRKPDPPVQMNGAELIAGIKPALEQISAAQGIELAWDVSGLPEQSRGYPEVLRLVLNNLVTNAVNHAYADSTAFAAPEIRICCRQLIPDRLELSVEDDGRGIEPRELKRIFDPFYRDYTSRSRQEKGSGLGLFIARRKAAVSGGSLSVECPYRRIDGTRESGCRFVLRLPNMPDC